jgi:hypothetical protein
MKIINCNTQELIELKHKHQNEYLTLINDFEDSTAALRRLFVTTQQQMLLRQQDEITELINLTNANRK